MSATNVQPDALADVLQDSACLSMTLPVSIRIQDACLLQLMQSACVHLKLPLQLCNCLCRLLVALLESCLDAMRLLAVDIGVVYRRQTQVLVDILCTKQYHKPIIVIHTLVAPVC